MGRKASEKTKCDYCPRSYVDVPGHVRRQHLNKIQNAATVGGKNSRRSRTPTTPIAEAGSIRNISAVGNGTSATTAKEHKLAYKDFENALPGDRVLTCGYGEQLGHPKRLTTKKPLAIETLPADTKILQVVAGDFHTAILTDKRQVY
uniref:Uncharacterized protein n=1 Tax=Panagrolaimus davidi TaxID=227884 RepID=A0A914R4Z6_9BILA